MTRHSQRHRSTTLPFKYDDNALEFEPEHYTLNGGSIREIDLAPGQNTIDIAPTSPGTSEEGEGSWDWVTLYGSLRVPPETIEELFPEEERDAPPAKLYVAVRCHETIYRDSRLVQPAPTTAGEYDVDIRISWDNFRGTIELCPYLVRTEEGDEGSAYARSPNVKVASGERYEVIVDHWDDPDPPTIDGEEASFSRTEYLPDGEKLYYLDFRNEARPKLWINADNARVADLLRSRGSVGAEPRMRDVVLDQISYGVWMQLIVRAASAVDHDGDVEYEWQRTILEAFVPELYDVDDIEDATHQIREDVRDPDGVARLVSRIDTELQEYLDPREQLINLMEEGVHI